jgi:hypothetical protein
MSLLSHHPTVNIAASSASKPLLQPSRAATLSAQVTAKSGLSILGNENPASYDQKEAFRMNPLCPAPSEVDSEELRAMVAKH